MKFFLYFGLITISFAICECLKCYNCYRSSKLVKMDTVIENMHNDNETFETKPCNYDTNGKLVGPFCETPKKCGYFNMNMGPEIEIFDLYFCFEAETKTVFRQFKYANNKYLKGYRKICSTDLCNGASSITITSLVITIVLLLLLLFS
ncbi:uncharacterized protein LOC127276569 [Leptopilina boulardi]|uniref:uncharacterized protein LOC127276569 n=1 Tax=Leptopilina boulardi TaxID=63433 RepID=UPI0021F64DEF|nr:uncharacterized protein LOC127276569 [Leptopilina boulardi]